MFEHLSSTVGELVRFLDPEGNDIGAMRYESPVHTCLPAGAASAASVIANTLAERALNDAIAVILVPIVDDSLVV